MVERTPSGRAVTGCTIVARNYLPAARVLARSYHAHHPGDGFVIAVIDAAPEDPDLGEQPDGYRLVGPPEFDIDEQTYLRMATAYSVTELATSVKPYLLRTLRTRNDVVIYLDPDIEVYAPMPELVTLATEHGIVLTPHFLSPLPRDGKEPSEADIMGAGIFNLGFVAVGPGSEGFLDFWAERLRTDAIASPAAQLFTDQRWVDQVPSLFSFHVLRDPGCNVAYWNLHERGIARDGATPTAGGKPLRFFHFSGYRPERPWVLSKYCEREPRVTLSQIPELRRLCDSYGRSLREAGYAETLDAVPYAFATIGQQPVGTHLTHSMRRMYRDAWLRAERLRQPSPPHAFGADLGRGFREWLTAPANIAEQVTGLNRLAMAVWRRRPDLQGAFPRPTGTDAAAFREWCHTSGLTEHELTPWALPTEPDPVAEPIDDFGVNVLGYLTAELGIGEMGRIVLRAVELADVPVVSVVEDEELLNRTNIAPPRNLGTPRFGVSLLAVNADQTSVMLDRHPAMAASRYRIGLWAWELEEFPDEFHSAFDLVDEVWTVSAFCAKAIAAHSPVPVYAIPVPVPDPGLIPRAGATRNSPPQFLFMFDFNSIIGRKNPYGLIEAFSRAFDDGDDARLVIKAINGERHPQAAEKLRLRIAEDRRIELIEDYLPIDQLDQLYRDSDCYVSLHRSEGFGLTVAEAMIRALPVIATDYSGTTEFLDESTGWPVPYAMTTVGGDDEPYPEGARWAEPDLDAAAEAMREVVDDPSEAMRRGAAARAHLLANRSMAEAGHWLADRLSAAHDDWLTRRSAGAPAAHSGPPDPVAAVRNASEALRWRPNPGTASRSPISPAVRRLTLRAIDHYDVHQRSVMRALLDGVTEGMQRVTDRLDAMEGRLAETERRALRSWTVNTEILRDVGNLEFETHTLRSELAKEAAQRAHAIRTEIEPLREYTDGALDAVRAHTHAMFADRDRRSDAEEAEFAGLAHDVAGLYTAARMAHAPVPSDADIAVCDAGVLLLPRDRVMLPWLRHHGSWERAEADLMAEIAGDGTFLDVGAHVGYHTLRLLGRSPQTPRVVAVEANPDTVPLLRRNIAVNLPSDVAGHVTVLAVAAWDSEGKVRLVHVEADNSGDHRVSQGGIGGVTVPALRLDGVSEVASERVSLVKVDLQGRDHRALDGLATVLRRDRPHVVCEFSPEPITEFGDDPAKVLAGYRDLGYRIALAGDRSEPEDAELVRQAETAATGFITLWLRPS